MQWMMKSASAGIEEGAADIRFVMKQLEEQNVAGSQQFLLAGRLDLKRVAAMGHSAGGAFAARACQLDVSLKACVDLDGTMFPVAALPVLPDRAAMKQPLLLLEAHHKESEMFGTKEEIQEYFRKKEQQLQSCAPDSYDVILKSPGIAHPSFSDIPLLCRHAWVSGNQRCASQSSPDTVFHSSISGQEPSGTEGPAARWFVSRTSRSRRAALWTVMSAGRI
jgi:hypothetical protein